MNENFIFLLFARETNKDLLVVSLIRRDGQTLFRRHARETLLQNKGVTTADVTFVTLPVIGFDFL